MAIVCQKKNSFDLNNNKNDNFPPLQKHPKRAMFFPPSLLQSLLYADIARTWLLIKNQSWDLGCSEYGMETMDTRGIVGRKSRGTSVIFPQIQLPPTDCQRTQIIPFHFYFCWFQPTNCCLVTKDIGFLGLEAGSLHTWIILQQAWYLPYQASWPAVRL